MLTLGKYIKRTRAAQDLTLRHVAQVAEITPAYLSDIEHDRRIPAEAVLRRLATVLDVAIDELMARAGRLDEGTAEYVRTHPGVNTLLRAMAEAAYSDDQIAELVARIKGIDSQIDSQNAEAAPGRRPDTAF